jgi:hypothetical protein
MAKGGGTRGIAILGDHNGTHRQYLPTYSASNLLPIPQRCGDEDHTFAADYQEDEYTLLGMAIKYAGLRGKEVRVIGKNRQTLGEEDRIQ